MWLGLVSGDQWGLGSGAPFDYGGAGPGKLRPWIGIKSVDGMFVPWQPSQTDMLAKAARPICTSPTTAQHP